MRGETSSEDTIMSDLMSELTEEADRAVPMGHAARAVLSDLERYWHELCQADRLPFRSEIDPTRIDTALPHSFMLQRVAPRVGRVRVAGQALSDLLGLDPRGMPLTAFFTPAAREVLGGQLSDVFDRPAMVELPIVSPRGLGRPRLEGRLLLLPLAGEDGAVSTALGALVTEGEAGRTPRRFDIPLTGEVRAMPVAGIQSARRGPVPNPLIGRPRGAPGLRLVVDNG